MSNIAKLCAGLVVCVLALVPSAARAEQMPLVPTAKAADGQLSIEDLKKMVVNLGYEKVKEYKNSKGELTSFSVMVTSGNWNFSINFDISPSKRNIWLVTYLVPVAKPEAIPAKVALGLLDANRTAWPASFYFNVKYSKFVLTSFVLNGNLKPAELRRAIENYVKTFQAFEKYWNPKKWS